MVRLLIICGINFDVVLLGSEEEMGLGLGVLEPTGGPLRKDMPIWLIPLLPPLLLILLLILLLLLLLMLLECKVIFIGCGAENLGLGMEDSLLL